MPTDRRLNVFICHASQDKPTVRALYDALKAEGWIDPWLDKAKILPGQDWRMVIENAVEESDLVIVCLSKQSTTKEGFVQKEIRYAYDIALEKPEGIIFLIPLRLEECDVPRGLRSLQWVDYFGKDKQHNYQDLLEAITHRARSLGIETVGRSGTPPNTPSTTAPREEVSIPVGRIANPLHDVTKKKIDPKVAPADSASNDADLSQVLEHRLPTEGRKATAKPRGKLAALQGVGTPAAFQSLISKETPSQNEIVWSVRVTIGGIELVRVPKGKFVMGNNEINNAQPQHTLDIPYDYWMGRFPVTNAQYNQFTKKDFDKGKENHPVIRVTWHDAQKYVEWMNEKFNSQLPKGLIFRLPSEAEWEKAARSTNGRIYPWGNAFDKNKCNTSESGKKDTTPVGLYSPQGDSPYGCADMAGNVWEWTRSLYKFYPYRSIDGREDEKDTSSIRCLRGGSWHNLQHDARVSFRYSSHPYPQWNGYGFRVVVASPPV
jgi:formylglycine-generating enzyme required for sulfatase activity